MAKLLSRLQGSSLEIWGLRLGGESASPIQWVALRSPAHTHAAKMEAAVGFGAGDAGAGALASIGRGAVALAPPARGREGEARGGPPKVAHASPAVKTAAEGRRKGSAKGAALKGGAKGLHRGPAQGVGARGRGHLQVQPPGTDLDETPRHRCNMLGRMRRCGSRRRVGRCSSVCVAADLRSPAAIPPPPYAAHA